MTKFMIQDLINRVVTLSIGQISSKKTKRDEFDSLSIEQRCYNKKMKWAVTRLDVLPPEILSDILARVASNSLTDLLNAKMSCKDFCNAAEDPHVYQHVSLEGLPTVGGIPRSEEQQAFLDKCEECDNLEIMYRKAVVSCLKEQSIESTLNHLDKACKLGHIGSMYVKCIVMLASDDNAIKEDGAKLLSNMKKNMCSELIVSRKKLIGTVTSIWFLCDSRVINHPIFCTKRDDHNCTTMSWSGAEDQGEDVDCADCIAHEEFSLISGEILARTWIRQTTSYFI